MMVMERGGRVALTTVVETRATAVGDVGDGGDSADARVMAVAQTK